MKNIVLLITIALTLNSCNNDDDNNTESLPPATQTGAGTFACKINGKSFIDTGGGYFNCYYQFVDGGYYFGIGGDDDDNLPQSIYIQTDKKSVSEGGIYPLIEDVEGNAYGGGGFTFSINNSYRVYTNTEYTGELTIKKMDFESHIVSGTFWFDLQHPLTGETVEIRDGRFDTLFTE